MRLPQVLFACVFGGLALGSSPGETPVIVIQGADYARTAALGEALPSRQIAISGEGSTGIVVHEQEFSHELLDGPDPWQREEPSANRFSADTAGGTAGSTNTSFSTGFRSRGADRYGAGLGHRRSFNYHPGTRNRGNFPQMRNLNMRNALGGGSSIQYGSRIDYGRNIQYQRGRRFQSDIKYGFR